MGPYPHAHKSKDATKIIQKFGALNFSKQSVAPKFLVRGQTSFDLCSPGCMKNIFDFPGAVGPYPHTHKSKDATKIILLTLTGCSAGNSTRVKPSKTISQAESRVDAVKDLKRKIVT